MNGNHLHVTICLLVLCAAFTFGTARADDAKTPTPHEDKDGRAEALEHLRRFTLSRAEDDSPVGLIEQPLLAFGDAARIHNRGTFWAWGTTGRPLALMEVWRETKAVEVWIHSITLTSTEPVVLKGPGLPQWRPRETRQEFKPLADAPRVSDKRTQRTRQLKDLARRFTAYERHGDAKARVELRLLVQPVHRYEDPARDILDGAVFVVAHDTNPEAVLLIEAVQPDGDDPHWQYGLSRSTNSEAHIELDGREVWVLDSAGPANLGLDKAYWLFELPVENR